MQREQTKHENEREHLQTFEKALHLSSLVIIISVVIVIASFLHRSRRRSRRGRKVMIVIPANTNVPPMVSPPSVIMRINHNTRFNDLPPLFVLVLHVVVIVQTTPFYYKEKMEERRKSDDGISSHKRKKEKRAVFERPQIEISLSSRWKTFFKKQQKLLQHE